MKSKIYLLTIIVIIILLAGNVYFAFRYFSLEKELTETRQALKTQQINEKVLNFTNLFITKVLKAEGEVSFEDRLQLENAVRALEDENILSQWQRFTESETEETAQNEVKNLLEMLVNKVAY